MPFDDKADVRAELDLSAARWQRPSGPDDAGEPPQDAVEIAFVSHVDGHTYVAMRQASDPGGTVLVFTPAEWEAFVAGAKDGEFDEPW